MKSNKNYYDDRQLEKLIGDIEEEDDIRDLARTIVFSVKRQRKVSYLIKYLKREKSNVPLSAVKKVIRNNKESISGLEAYYDYGDKQKVFEDIEKDIIIYMRDYRIDQVDLD